MTTDRVATGRGIGGHHLPVNQTDSWVTPKWVAEAVAGAFDLDPCEATPQPWPLAKAGYAVGRGEDGLALPWHGAAWVNPPYSDPAAWAKKLAEHGNGVLLTFARVETAWWQDWVWPFAASIWFPRGRLNFCRPDGTPGRANSGAPSAFAAYGDRCDLILHGLRDRFGGFLAQNFTTKCPTEAARAG